MQCTYALVSCCDDFLLFQESLNGPVMNGSVHEAILTSGADFNHFGATAEISGIQKYSVEFDMYKIIVTESLQIKSLSSSIFISGLILCYIRHKDLEIQTYMDLATGS